MTIRRSDLVQKPKPTLGFVTGKDIEVNRSEALGLKPQAQPDFEVEAPAPKVEEKKAPAKKAPAKEDK